MSFALMCLQLGWSLYGDLLRAMVQQTDDAQALGDALAAVYREVALLPDDV